MLCFAVGGDPSIDDRRRLVGMVANGLTRGVQSRRFTLNTLHGLGWGCEDRISVEYEYMQGPEISGRGGCCSKAGAWLPHRATSSPTEAATQVQWR